MRALRSFTHDSNIPVEQPAKALCLTVPQSLLASPTR
jgi:hypothetical protein